MRFLSPFSKAKEMMRWLTPCLIGLILSAAGCSVNECCQHNVCSHFMKPAETQAVPKPQVENRSQTVDSPAPLQLPPALEKQATVGSAPIPRRLPAGEPSQASDAPLIVQTDNGFAQGTLPPTTASPPNAADDSRKPIRLTGIDPREIAPESMPKFRQPIAWTEDALPMPSALKPVPAVPGKTSEQAMPIEILNHVPGTPTQKPGIRIDRPSEVTEFRGRGVRDSHYPPMGEDDVQAVPPMRMAVGPLANLGPAKSANPLAVKNALRFGRPRAIPAELPKDLFEFHGNLDASAPIAPLIVSAPPVTPVIMASMRARTRRPHFLDAPIAKESVVVLQVEPSTPGRSEPDVEIVQHDSVDDLPSAILPFVIVQNQIKEVSFSSVAKILEPVPQIIIYRRGDLGPPEIADNLPNRTRSAPE